MIRLIDYSQDLNSERSKVIIKSFHLEELLNNLYNSYAQKCNKSVIDFKLILGENLPKEIKSDDIRIKQLLSNLLDNAIKFTQEGHIFFTCKVVSQFEQNYEIQLSIEDTGVGFDMAKAQRLFDPFTQGDERMNRQFEGSGLGLAIAKHCAQTLGTAIEYKSQLNQGSTFWINLKVESITSELKDSTHTNMTPSNHTFKANPNILLVEDNDDNIFIMQALLKKLNCRCSVAENGALALDLYPKGNWDLIFMDINMPVMDGLEATRRIRQVEATDRCFTPIVALTALTLSEDRERCKKAGMDDFLAKPIKIEELRSMLTKWCSSGSQANEFAI